MISLPLLISLDVTDYGLYPGDDSATPGLHIRFASGLTLVLGANGLGKTTLITMLYRLLTGPSDIPALLRGTDLGTASLQPTELNGNLRRTFAQRVADGAVHATARLLFHIGDEEVSIERNLRDLSLRSFRVGTSPASQDEQQYEKEMVRLANVSTFGDWILLLRYIVFYFEDRRSLVWDPSAQRQLLRILFLEPSQAQYWTDSEREILEADTRVRNFRAVATREESTLVQEESLAANEPEMREELRNLERLQGIDNASLDEINSNLSAMEAHYESTRLRFLILQQERESIYRELERAQLLAVNARLPKHSDSARYILAQLLTKAECLVCGNSVPGVMASMESRIRANECIVCGTDLTSVSEPILTEFADEEIRRRQMALQAIDGELEAARIALEESQSERDSIVTEIQSLQTAIAERSARVDFLLRRLPPEEAELQERRREFSSLRASVAVLQHELDEKRKSFSQIITDANVAIERHASAVLESFRAFAHEFLFEECRLLWSPRAARLGQAGTRFEFPAFELELGGSNFTGTVRRGGPDEVSESQREFIDVSFRMALARVAAQRKVTSLVMDAPESSLDTVFIDRAARVLGTFGRPELGNRLIVTTNLVAGQLIPALLRNAANQSDRLGRVVDLLAIAAPTAALRNLRDEYEVARDQLLNQADDSE